MSRLKTKINRRYWGLVVLLFFAIIQPSCARSHRLKPAEWNNCSRILRINIESVPSGAAIYGISGSNLGVYIGTTPYTLKYSFDNGTWVCLGCKGNNDLMPTSITDNMFVKACHVRFTCAIVKEDYKPYVIDETLRKERGNAPFSQSKDCFDDLEGTVKTYTAYLQRTHESAVPPQPPQQQQQQQQQQNIIIPDPKESFGKIILSCDVQDAEVYIDGVFVGNAPATLKLKDGIHIVEVKSDGYKDYRKELRVLGGSELSLRAKLTRK